MPEGVTSATVRTEYQGIDHQNTLTIDVENDYIWVDVDGCGIPLSLEQAKGLAASLLANLAVAV